MSEVLPGNCRRDNLLLFQLITAVFTLTLQHPAGVFAWQCAHGIQLLQFVVAQANSGSSNIVIQLRVTFRANDHAAHHRLVQQPVQVRFAPPIPLCCRQWRASHPHNRKPGLYSPAEVKRQATAPASPAVTTVFAAQQTTRQRAPDHQPHAFALHHRHQFALQIAPGNGVIGL